MTRERIHCTTCGSDLCDVTLDGHTRHESACPKCNGLVPPETSEEVVKQLWRRKR